MVKNMADSRIVFHFYATSLPPPGKAEEGKQSRISSAALSLTRHVNAARLAKQINISRCSLTIKRQQSLENLCFPPHTPISCMHLFNYNLNHKQAER